MQEVGIVSPMERNNGHPMHLFPAMFMTLYATFLIPGFLKKVTFYRVLMGIAVLLMGYGGVIKHIDLTQNSPALYCCTAAMIVGPGINVFGLVLNIMGASGKFNE